MKGASDLTLLICELNSYMLNSMAQITGIRNKAKVS